MKKTFVAYFLMLISSIYALFYIIKKGSLLSLQNLSQASVSVTATSVDTEPMALGSVSKIVEQFSHNIQHPFSLLLLQTMVILLIARLFGTVAKKLGQPSVIGEILAGIALGPSLLGLFFPQVFHFLFPPESLINLQFLSQIGLVLFMFIIGMELDVTKLKNKMHQAFIVSQAGILVPLTLGVLLAYYLYPSCAPSGVPFMSFALFIGVAMSITAFPVLARIIQERGLKNTSLGTIAITCAAADDVVAWCLLACVIAIVKAGGIGSALFTIFLSFIFVGVMLYLVRPLIRKACLNQLESDHPNKGIVAVSFFTMLVSAYLSDIIGIHALFGAFLAGVVMPQSIRFKTALTEKVEDVSLLMFLPIFFAFSGLRTQIDTLNHSSLWIMTAAVITVAILGKLGGCGIVARLVGLKWSDALSLGALMNARGLVELVVLNIGYDLGVLSPTMFTMMVLMALTTTFLSGPILDFIQFVFPKKN